MTDRLERLRSVLGDRYTVERELATGGMASVYLASDRTNHRNVAIKVFRADLADRAGVDRFEREIQIVANLAHPHILPLHDSGSIEDLRWFVSPWIEGESLHDRLDREGQLPVGDALRIGLEIAEALAYAHSRGLVHRDVKPRNILMEAGHAVLADFGIALQVDSAPGDRLTTPGVSPGTPHYMSPEQLTGERTIDGRSDIYSLGCVLYQMLTGDPPFTGSRVDVIRARKLAGIVPDLRTVRSAVPDALERLTLRCLAVAPADRFRDAAALVEELKEVSDEWVRSGAGRNNGSDRTGPTVPLVRVRRWIVTGLIGAGIAAGFAALVGFLSTRAFDIRLQVPAAYTPSRSDYMTTGFQALVPFAVFGFIAIVGWILIRQASRLSAAVARKYMPDFTARIRTVAPRWRSFWESARPRTVADTFLASALLISVLVVLMHGELLSTLFTNETEILSCANRGYRHSFTYWMVALIIGLSIGWFAVFRWLDRRGKVAGIGISRWGSVALIVLLLLIYNVPWRIFWDSNERLLVNGEPAYLLVETADELVVYNPAIEAVEVHGRSGPETVVRKNINGYIFEERSAFDSPLRQCLSITQAE